MGNNTLAKTTYPRVPFAAVVRLNTDRVADPAAAGIERYVGIEHITPGDLRVRSWGLVAEGTTFTNRFRPGQVLFPKRRAYQRKVALADFEGVCSGDIYVFETKDPAVLLPELLPFICQTDGFFDHAIGTSAGSLSPRTNWSHLAAYEFPLPPPDEQRRLVEVLSATETTLHQIVECVDSGSSLVESAFRHIFQEDSDFQSCPLAEASIMLTNGFVGSAASHYVENGVPYLRSTNIRRHRIDKSELVYVSEEFHQQNTKSQLLEGDLLTVQSGHVGETAMVSEMEAGWNCHALIITRLKRSLIEPAYVSLYLNSLYGRRDVARYLVGSTVMHINTSDLAKMKIPIPSKRRQRQVITYGGQMLSQVQALQRRLDVTRTLKRSLIEYLFDKSRDENYVH